MFRVCFIVITQYHEETVQEILVDTQRNCKMSTIRKSNKQYNITSFRDVMLYSLVDGYQCVTETYYFHLQGRSWTQHVPLKCWYPSTKPQCHISEDHKA